MAIDETGKTENKSPDLSFIRILLLDVIDGLEAQLPENAAGQRRDLIRRMFAAIEGLTCIYRDHIRRIAKDLDLLNPEIEMALDELTYSVDEQGKIKNRVQYVPTTSMLRLITNLAVAVSEDFSFDFGDQSWLNFKTAIGIRNRITHPSQSCDLDVSDNDLKLAKSSILWIIARVTDAMAATTSHHEELSEIAALLLSGDRDTITLYEYAKLSD